jgi:cytochrome c5
MKHFLPLTLAFLAMANIASADTASDKEAFSARCAKCHGESGTGTMMLGRRLGKDKGMLERRTDLQSVFVRHVVRNGIVSMPPLTRVEVTDDELDAILRYLTRSQTSSTPSTP